MTGFRLLKTLSARCGPFLPVASVLLLGTLSPLLLPGYEPDPAPREARLDVPREARVDVPRAESQDDLTARAVTLRRNGAYEEAAALFGRLAASPSTSPSMQLAAAEALLAAGDSRGAIDTLPLGPISRQDEGTALVLRGEALVRLGDTAEAVAAFGSVASDHPLAGYARFRVADLYRSHSDSADAIPAYEAALALPIASTWRIVGMRRVAGLYSDRGDAASAGRWLEQASAEAADRDLAKLPTWFDADLSRLNVLARRAAVLLDLGEAYQDAGRRKDALLIYQELVTQYPQLSEAREALNRLAAMGLSHGISDYWRGLVLYYAGEPTRAMDAITSFLDTEPSEGEAATAAFYRAQAQRNAGDRQGAQAALVAIAGAYPGSPQAAEALWLAARIVEATASRAEAIDAYAAVLTAFPGSEFAARAGLRAGSLASASGNAPRAREIWSVVGRNHPDAKARTQSLFWLGRGQMSLGDQEIGRATLRDAAKDAPEIFEGIRSRDLAEGGIGAEPFTRSRVADLGRTTASVDSCASWIDRWSGDVSGGDFGATARLDRIDLMVAAGLRSEALAESLDATAALASRPKALYRLAVALELRGLYPAAIHAATVLAGLGSSAGAAPAPRCLQQLILPLAYGDLVQDAARRYNLDPYLLLALLRQESWFGSHALSSAQARGLSQVIPATAREIARELGVTGFTPEDLYRPKESIRFGAWYLGRQIANAGRRPIVALAAYNGGPGNAQRWTQGDGGIDPDEFVEAIDYAETRTYVRSIYELYTRYRSAYD